MVFNEGSVDDDNGPSTYGRPSFPEITRRTRSEPADSAFPIPFTLAGSDLRSLKEASAQDGVEAERRGPPHLLLCFSTECVGKKKKQKTHAAKGPI